MGHKKIVEPLKITFIRFVDSIHIVSYVIRNFSINPGNYVIPSLLRSYCNSLLFTIEVNYHKVDLPIINMRVNEMKLFYSKGACSLVVRIVINEIGLKSEFESVDLKTKQTESDQDFFQINPKGSVPTLQLDNGVVLTENAVILQYLADTAKAHSLLPAVGNFERYRVLEWVNYITTEVHKSFGGLFNPTVSDEVKNTVFIPLIKSKFKYINQSLEHTKYLAGDHFTLPDAYLFVMMRWAESCKIDLSTYPKLISYQMQLKDRLSIQKSLKEEGFIKE